MVSPPRYTARTDDLVVQELGDELLIYDKRTDVAHCLAPAAAVTWRKCDGKTPFEAIVAEVAAISDADDAEAMTTEALSELLEKDLVHGQTSAGGVSRRQALRRLA